MKGFLSYVKRNPTLGIGLGVLLLLVLFSSIGPFFISAKKALPLSSTPNQAPSAKYPFGTDAQGRDLLAVMIIGTGLTLQIGAISGAIGLGVGIVLGFVAGYLGGSLLDTIITSIIDVYMSIPAFLILIMVATRVSNM